ncbi:MAG TPA: glucuronate isomerase, partial [Clostridiaceae bacterium]|nr:glucuronate isomerase [Clostridiaceae bacterium]
MYITDKDILKKVVDDAVDNVKITDVHTHLYPGSFKNMLLWGIDDLLTYHYLIAEYFRYSDIDYDKFFELSKTEQADLIWDELFIKHSPVSEAQRGVLTVLNKLGLDLSSRDLNKYRDYFKSLTVQQYIDKVFELANIKEVVMTNDPFNRTESKFWDTIGNSDKRFKAALRIDPLLNNYDQSFKRLQELGYKVDGSLDKASVSEIKRFLKEWALKIDALYMAVSLPCEFMVPEDSDRSLIIENCVLPVCRELGIPFAMMIGTKRLVNYKLRLAGDSVGKADIKAVEYLCKRYPENKFMVTMLSKENQHELAVTARKFRNLMIFGCWWFLNNPSIVHEITRFRMEMLGLSFIPQHSDARVLDQLIYKWSP